METSLFVGIDVGTSGVRAVALDARGQAVGTASAPLPAPVHEGRAMLQDPALWWMAAERTLGELARVVPLRLVRALAVDGTSGTVLVTDAAGEPLGPARMYGDAACADEAERIEAVAPRASAARGGGSALARLLRLQDAPGARHALHQADWIAGRLMGRFGLTDENNALKTGYDPVERAWPPWLPQVGLRTELLPEVREPGTPLGTVSAWAAERFGLPVGAVVVAGTTDGCASFLATGAERVGDGVTALGSTLTLKLLSDVPVFAPEFGIYSHRLRGGGLGGAWLVGGASNCGGAVLRRFFDDARMADLEREVEPGRPTGLGYYPLPRTGERFPFADPGKAPRLEPRPPDDATFFQGLLEGLAEVERLGYERLEALGGPAPTSIRAVGRGASNPAYMAIRQRVLGRPFAAPRSQEAAVGTAFLARRALEEMR